MNKTSLTTLVALAAFFTAASAILTFRFYGALPGVPATVAVALWGLAVVCVIMAVAVRRALRDGRIGIDRSQLNPITIANWLIVGKASAFTGAVIGGVYLGIGVYVIPHAKFLVAAADDLPGVLTCILGSLALTSAGLFLEKSCFVPPGEANQIG